jgi:hypothetical protein
MYGASDPVTTIPLITADLKAAGFDNVFTEAQRQVDEFRRTK